MPPSLHPKDHKRTLLETLGWVLLVGILWGTDLAAKFSARNQSGVGLDDFTLISEQVTSALAVLMMVPFLIQWLKLFPFSRELWARAVIGHTIGTVFFAFGHFALMVLFRSLWYGLHGRNYIWRDPFVNNLLTEYQKDIKIYIGFVMVIVAYQLYTRSRSDPPESSPERLVVQSGSGDVLLRFDEIDYLEAARNYVSVHQDDREYVIRETMTNVVDRLPASRFVRTHRSYIVNIEKIREIQSVESGLKVVLINGRDVPVSRKYREALTQATAGR